MRIYNSFIAALALTFAAVTVALAAYGVDKLDAYFSVYTIAILVLTLFYVSFSPKARRALGMVGAAAFAGFLVIAALKVMEILGRR
ncbi:MAG: hypothetical protein HY673_09025 [Chloroflexi bacterium]|nr:hypothetical protein [Chloroflexota bacterium]